ncbi:hypothetical protein C9374_014027 [Naegleria lovaniensis]|uniref:Oxidoreductase n=1 Tax=Naegleria lovaniensis TaxID=51637 RepID=A0AA88GV50_NAELO|nr:uncharacterized protein C9374_014027 [Naegleria lovaniensis]KAG2389467.1 hypothetical protein C9374_014027 [Naegleria lovaniensis]
MQTREGNNVGNLPDTQPLSSSSENNDDVSSISLSQNSSSPFAHHQLPLETIVSESEINLAASVLERLSHHSYHLQDPRLAQLIHAGSLLFKRKISKEEQAEMKRESRKKAKEKFKNHDKSILMQSVMQMKKHNEVHYLRQQIAMIPNAPNSEVPKLTHAEEDEVIIESITDEDVVSSCRNSSNEQNDKKSMTETMNDNNEQNGTASDMIQPSNSNNSNKLLRAVRCYICHEKTHEIHHFYHKMCPKCGEFNLEKRNQTMDMTGKICLVTGGRIKIGFYTALKLLRCNAELVIVTSRFPKDCAKRYSLEPDFEMWKDRLKVYGIDFKHIPSVVQFADHLNHTLPRLDILINCAAQTIRKPTAYYEHVAKYELTTSLQDLSETQRKLLPLDFSMKIMPEQKDIALRMLSSMEKREALEYNPRSKNNDEHEENSTITLHTPHSTSLKYNAMRDEVNVSSSSLLCQIPILDEDKSYNEQSFPRDVFDVNQNQADFRNTNSWIQKLDQVPVFEMLEVQTINVTAPFILTSKLKPLLEHGATHSSTTNPTHEPMSFVINVSSMEGQFYRRSKGVHHPHLNMAKASLNMMTRTSAADYAKDFIYMSSVDTGWNNDENPLSDLENISQTYYCPLDEVDGAARILDPIFLALQGKQKYFGVFLKNYSPFRW